MGTRRQARIYALQALYQMDLSDITGAAALNLLWTGLLDEEGQEEIRAPESSEVEFAQRIVLGVEEHRAKIDALIEECSINWRLARMPLVDRNVLRIAAFELLLCADVPATVSVNESIELAKAFGTADSRAFVNGIVDRIGRSVGRLDGKRRRGKTEQS